MELERDVLVSPITEVPVVEGELVLAIRALADCGVGSKAIARAVGVARNTVRRYLRQSIESTGQVRPTSRRLTDDRRLEARTLYEGPAGVVGRDRGTGTVIFHPTYLAFCRDWDVQPRACAPYRARTKGKTEAGVKFVKRNGLAEQAFDSFAALEAHLAAWMAMADAR